MGCTVDRERYSAPMPWIGLYITAASAACSIAMLVDYVHDIRHRKVWIPCKIFSLNATSLTLLAIATKLPVDLSTPMPGALEQVSKLSGTSLLCIAMAHFMPSIGAMEDSQVILNVVPLVILVITVIVNICIQIGTGVIHAFIPEHIVTLCFMLTMLMFTCSSALAIPTMKGLLKQQLELKCQEMQHMRQPNEPAMSTVESLKRDLKKYMIMALSSNPQYVLARSNLGAAAGIFSYYQAAVLIQALVRAMKRSSSVPVCINQSSSEYKWSIGFIVFSQAFTVVVGALAPYIRVMLVELDFIRIRESQDHQTPPVMEIIRKRLFTDVKSLRKVKRYWIQNLMEWMDRHRPLSVFDIQNRFCQRFFHGFKVLIHGFMTRLQVAVIVFGKVCKQSSSVFSLVMGILMSEMSTRFFSPSGTSGVDFAATNTELRTFVLHLEGEDGLVDKIIHFIDVNTEKWKQEGCSIAADLINLLKKVSDDHPGFVGEAQFHIANRVQGPSNCWALPLVTLTSIALAIPCAQGDQIKQQLRDGLSEGLKYIRHVDKSLDSQGRLAKVREAAYVVWHGLHLYNQWLDVDLAAFAAERGGPKNVIEQLANKGSRYEDEVESLVKGRGDMKSGLRWPPRALALYSMANICKSILITHSNFNIDDADALFKQLHVVISDMLGACLADLPRALYMQCHKSSMEAKEDRVMDAACLLGEAENILKVLPTGGLVVNQGKYVERWRSFMPNWSDLPCISPVNASDAAV
ncbi:hypothetical protein ACLOJK_038956 [Asimina triloba]